MPCWWWVRRETWEFGGGQCERRGCAKKKRPKTSDRGSGRHLGLVRVKEVRIGTKHDTNKANAVRKNW